MPPSENLAVRKLAIEMPIYTWPLICIATSIVTVGCTGPANQYNAVVTGTVTIDGELANSGTVTFHPVKKGGLPAIGRIFSDGSYSLRTGQGDLREIDGGTVESGDYVITVAVTGPPVGEAVIAEGGPPVPGPSRVASKYASKETSDLKRTVKPGPNVFVLELALAELEPPASDSEAEGDAVEEDAHEENEQSKIENAASDESADDRQSTSSRTSDTHANPTVDAVEESPAGPVSESPK